MKFTKLRSVEKEWEMPEAFDPYTAPRVPASAYVVEQPVMVLQR